MKARRWFVIGAVVGTIPSLQASALPPRTVWTNQIWAPSETIPSLAWRESQAVPQPQPLSFDIPPGSLDTVLKAFETVTGLTVTVADEAIRTLPSPGVTGVRTPEQALQRLLAGTSVGYRFLNSTTVAIDIRIASDAVQVRGAAPHVASPKYTAPLNDIPQTIHVIPRALLDEQGATTLTEALRNVPGITMQAGEGGGASNTSGDMFNMRGFSANNSLFVDGVRDDGLLARDVFNLEQIEVFSGPAGSDVGRTNAAGYVNLTTKTPHLETLRSGTVSYGSGDQFRTTLDVNAPLSLDNRGTFLGNAAVRMNVLWQEGGIAGRDYAGRASTAIAPSIAFGLNTATRVTVAGQILRQNNLSDYGLPVAASPAASLTPGAVAAATPVDQSTYYGSPDYDYDHVAQDNVTVRVEHDVNSRLSLRNQTRYNATARQAVITSIANLAAYDPTTNLVTLSRQANERHNDVWSNQTSLNARPTTGRLTHELSLGLEVTRERQLAPTLTGVGTRGPVDLNHPDVFSPVAEMNIVRSGAFADGRTKTLAVYAFDSIDLTSRLRGTGGIRAERYDTRSRAVSAAGVVTDLRGDGTLVSGKAGLAYRLNEDATLYVSYGTAITPPGSANFQLNTSAANQNHPNVDPQESTNYEVGTKWDLASGRVHVTGSYFWTDNRNVIFVVDANAVPPIFNQDDGQEVKGIAVSAVGRLAPWWDITLGAEYLDSTLKSQNPATAGKRLVLTPEVSGSVWSTVRLPRDVRIGGGLRYTDPVFVNAANTIIVPRYAVADALVEAPIGQRLTLRLNVYNVTDKVYIRNINNNGGRYNPGTPRSFLVTSAVRF